MEKPSINERKKIKRKFSNIGCGFLFILIALSLIINYLKVGKLSIEYFERSFSSVVWIGISYVAFMIISYKILYRIVPQISVSTGYPRYDTEKEIRKSNYKIKERVKHFFTKNQYSYYILISLILFILLRHLDIKFFGDEIPYGDILVEAHGLLFDVLIVAIFFSFYEKTREKNSLIERNLEKIEDCRNWKDIEASRIISSSVKRLSNVKVKRIPLIDSYVVNSDLRRAKLVESLVLRSKIIDTNLEEVKLTDSAILKSDFSRCNLRYSNLDDIIVIDSDFTGSYLDYAQLKNGVFINCIFTNTSFNDTDLQGMKINDEHFLEGRTVNLDGELLKMNEVYGLVRSSIDNVSIFRHLMEWKFREFRELLYEEFKQVTYMKRSKGYLPPNYKTKYGQLFEIVKKR